MSFPRNPLKPGVPQRSAGIHNKNDINTLGSKIIRAIVLPALEKEVNEGKNFAALRQVYSGMLLAAWYKRALKESLLSKIYANKAKVKGVDQDPKTNEEIYRQYLKAYKKGVFNFIKEDVDKYTNETIPRKYFSGGAVGYTVSKNIHVEHAMTANENAAMRTEFVNDKDDYAEVAAEEEQALRRTIDAAMTENKVKRKISDKAALAQPLGGIDFNSANLNLQIKRDGKGVPLPLDQQDMAQLNNIEGLYPVILSIKPANSLPIFFELSK